MAFIAQQFTTALKEAKLLNKDDVGKISELTKTKKLNAGKGYSRQTIRNVIYCFYTTTDEMVVLIMEYFAEKKKERDSIIKKQTEFAESLKTLA